MSSRWLFALAVVYPLPVLFAQEKSYDVVVYGGTSGGVIAAIQAAKMGKSVVLIEPSQHLGGLTSGGLGATDIGNKAAIGGLSREFYRRIAKYYDDESAWKQEKSDQFKSRRKASGEQEMWTFEPHVAEAVYRAWLKEYKIDVVLGERLKEKRGVTLMSLIKVSGGFPITGIEMESGRKLGGHTFIDATYEGDLMAQAGVPYHVGREANKTYGETLNGIQVSHAKSHQFIKDVDPYIKRGDPSSGLLPLISPDPPGTDGDGDHRVQAYNFRTCTTDVPANRRAWPKPDGYDEKMYELVLRNCEAGDHRAPWHPLFMPNRKTDTNNNFAISTDYIGANYAYPDADYATREKFFQDHKRYQMGLMYTLANNPRVPEKLRAEFQNLGLAKDEFVDSDNWPHQLYIREARRMISDVVMTQHHCQQKIIADDPVGLGAYNMDSHNCQRYVTKDGVVRNEGDIQVGVSPYRISYQAIRPKKEHTVNLLVPVCLAASHIAYGSIRMEPVFMVLGQSAATAACLAMDDGVAVQDLEYAKLKERLLADGQVLEWTGPVKQAAANAIDPKNLEGVVVDNDDAKLAGDWKSSASIGGFVGADYLHDNNEGKGVKFAAYTPTLPRPGLYEVRIYYTPNANRATNVPVTIAVGPNKKMATLDERKTPKVGRYASFGAFSAPAGRGVTVTIGTQDTDGYVVIDAVQFVPVNADEGVPAFDR